MVRQIEAIIQQALGTAHIDVYSVSDEVGMVFHLRRRQIIEKICRLSLFNPWEPHNIQNKYCNIILTQVWHRLEISVKNTLAYKNTWPSIPEER